jgi:hypothetical protein
MFELQKLPIEERSAASREAPECWFRVFDALAGSLEAIRSSANVAPEVVSLPSGARSSR